MFVKVSRLEDLAIVGSNLGIFYVIFFAVRLCHEPVLDGFDQLLSFGTIHCLTSALLLMSLGNIMSLNLNSRNSIANQICLTEMPGIKPRAAGCEAQTLPLCYATPPFYVKSL